MGSIPLHQLCCDKTSLKELFPVMHAAKRVAKILRYSDHKEKKLPLPFAFVLAIFIPQNDDSDLKILENSPLHSEASSTNQWDSETIVQCGIKWIVERLTLLLSNIDDAARSLFGTQWPHLCLMFSIRGQYPGLTQKFMPS